MCTRSAACVLNSLISAPSRISEDMKVVEGENFYANGVRKMMNTNVKEIKSEIASSQDISSEVFIREIVRNLSETRKYAEMHKDPELLYFTSMALQCANEKLLLSIYESN
jgi:hypothetical protein